VFPHVPDMKDSFPDLFADSETHAAAWLTAGLRYDTRDSQVCPYSGWMAGASVDTAPLQSRSGAGAVFTLEASGILPVPGLFHDGGDPDEENPPTDTLAVGVNARAVAGDLPFWACPSLGGDYFLRGYIGHRWTDRAAWHASAEYRFWWLPRGFALTDSIRIEHLGSALFYEAGAVAGDIPDLPRSAIRQSYGVSLRVSLERMALFRVDVGFSKEGVTYTAAYGLSF
jgi:outer membrane protein assembly factor BamA